MTLVNLDNTMFASLCQSTMELQLQGERAETALVQQTAQVNNQIEKLTGEKEQIAGEIAKTATQRELILQTQNQNIEIFNKEIESLEAELTKLKSAAATLEAQCTTAQNEINRLQSPAEVTQRAHAYQNILNAEAARQRALVYNFVDYCSPENRSRD